MSFLIFNLKTFGCRVNPTSTSDSDLLEAVRMSKMSSSKMTVVKRDGRKEIVHFDKITSRSV